MWFAKEYGEHFLEFRTSALFLGGGDSNYVSIYPIIGKEESNQFVFANGMNYFTRYLKICEVKI